MILISLAQEVTGNLIPAFYETEDPFRINSVGNRVSDAEICPHPHLQKNGDTAGLIRETIGKLPGEYRIVDAYRCNISPCVDCRYCRKHNGCAVKDEMQEVYEYIQECDNIMIASPVYFSELTGKLLDVGSRLQTYYCAARFRKEKPVRKEKRGAVILVGGGDGSMGKAYETACTLLRLMNCKTIHEPVCSHNTDVTPAAGDIHAIHGIDRMIRFLAGQADA